jgi:D-alanyl-D-alanine carboxypeptidase (penicillin-binding protein 5/6)
VLDAGNDRQPLPPASLTKLLTAIVASQTLRPDDGIPVSDRAAAEPANKIGMKAGQIWPFGDALYCMLMSSANDAAAAIGERIGGTLENFAAIMNTEGQRLGLADHPVLHDPAGLDDNSSVDGGNLLSARDVAIIARAALAQPTVAAVVGTDEYAFVGPDGVHHTLTNHIHSFLTGYPGAIGLKPGFTQKAGSGLALAARRGGRTLISVVLDAPNPYASGIGLLDRGFAMAPGAAGTGDVLPPVPLAASNAAIGGPAAPSPVPTNAIAAPRKPATRHGHDWGELTVLTLAALLAGLTIAARRREVRRRRSRRLAANRASVTSLDGRTRRPSAAPRPGRPQSGDVRRAARR